MSLSGLYKSPGSKNLPMGIPEIPATQTYLPSKKIVRIMFLND